MSEFAQRIIAWQKQHGRHDLPWQNTHDPYAIWVSEIMLQQTQVTAVIGYYQRFMQRFPTIQRLAEATQDEVLQYWSGLGYYSRARNLHRAAQMIMQDFQGKFPQDITLIQSLPGIGRSTAAAIAAFAFNQTHTILDGNVKRVLARHALIDGWPGHPAVEKRMWALAESLLPTKDMVAYTQGLMDLGATCCTRNKPQCAVCPLTISCGAYQQQRVHTLPAPKPKKVTPQKHTSMLIFQYGNEVLLEKRPNQGIWGGLWSLPEADIQDNPQAVALQRFGLEVEAKEPLPQLQHAFSHYKLEILPQPLEVMTKPNGMIPANMIWLSLEDAMEAAIPTPVRKILQGLRRPLT